VLMAHACGQIARRLMPGASQRLVTWWRGVADRRSPREKVRGWRGRYEQERLAGWLTIRAARTIGPSAGHGGGRGDMPAVRRPSGSGPQRLAFELGSGDMRPGCWA